MSVGSEEALRSVDRAMDRLGKARLSLEAVGREELGMPADWEIHGLLVDGLGHATDALAVWTRGFHSQRPAVQDEEQDTG